MRIWVYVICLAICFPAAVQGASSGSAGWFYVMPGGPRGGAATDVGASDSFAAEDSASSPNDGWLAGSYHVNGIDGWTDDTGFFSYDLRAPLLPGQSKSWTIYFWATEDAPLMDRQLQFGEWFSPSGDPLVIPRLEYVQMPAGVIGGPEVGDVWTEPWMWISLPYYSTTDGLTGHAFRFTLTMVPEPSSLAALSLALLPFGAALAKRRKG